MKQKKSPSFQFYPKDFISDEHVVVMTMAETGIYIRLLCSCWLQGSIPNDETMAGRLCGATVREMRGGWKAVSARFQVDPQDATRLRHKRLDEERIRQEEWRSKSSQGGKRRATNLLASGNGGNPNGSVFSDICFKPRNDDDEGKTASSNPGGGPGGGPDDDPIAQIQTWLQQYVAQFGIHWPMPDQGLCFSIFRDLNGATLDDLEKLLQELWAKKQRPRKGYAWFLTVVKARFENWHAA